MTHPFPEFQASIDAERARLVREARRDEYVREHRERKARRLAARAAQRPAVECWEIAINGSWSKVTWYIARSWSGQVRLNGRPWYGPSCLLHTGLPSPYIAD